MGEAQPGERIPQLATVLSVEKRERAGASQAGPRPRAVHVAAPTEAPRAGPKLGPGGGASSACAQCPGCTNRFLGPGFREPGEQVLPPDAANRSYTRLPGCVCPKPRGCQTSVLPQKDGLTLLKEPSVARQL